LRPAEGPCPVALRQAVACFITTGLFFMLLPGTFLGVWNLISISNRHALENLSPAWLQAHGHAQIFGWIGTFILGIGFYSLSKMGKLPPHAVRRAWLCYGLWTAGVTLRWTANVTAWEWRITLPASALLELAGFLVLFRTVSGHKNPVEAPPQPKKPWMLLVVAGSVGFLLALLLNVAAAADAALRGTGPAIASATAGLRIFASPAKAGVGRSLAFFVRAAYVWLAVAGCLTGWAAMADRAGGIWGASRHALTVGFLAAMVFAIGQKILPSICGTRTLFSERVMFSSLVLLNLGCALRVCSEIPAYEGFAPQAWQVLPVSAVIELLAVTLFAANLLLTFAPVPFRHSRLQERIS
jgi:hypothetical protein